MPFCGPTAAVEGRAPLYAGATLEIAGVRVRIWGVDAPESAQTCQARDGRHGCGQRAANGLDGLIAGRPVACRKKDTDRYGRMVARCTVGGEDIGGWLVREGLAVRYGPYAGSAYLAEERAARENAAGVWAGSFENPWGWRRAHRSGRSHPRPRHSMSMIMLMIMMASILPIMMRMGLSVHLGSPGMVMPVGDEVPVCMRMIA